MKINARNYICMLVALMMCMLTACGSSGEANETIDDETGYVVYYVDSEWQSLQATGTSIDQFETLENALDSLVQLMTDDAKVAAGAELAIPEGVTYQRYYFDGDSTVVIVCNADLETTDAYSLLLFKEAFTRTICQIDGIEVVAFEVTDLIKNQEIISDSYTLESFSSIDSSFIK